MVKKLYPAVLLKNFISIEVNRLLSFSWRVRISLPYKRMGTASAFRTFIPEIFWTKVGLKVLFRIPSICANFASFCWLSFHFTFKPQCKDTVISKKLINSTIILNSKMHGQNCTQLFQNALLQSSRIIIALRVEQQPLCTVHVCVKREMDPSHDGVNSPVTR